METITPLHKSDSNYQPKWLTLFRVALGLIIFWKGITFFKDSLAVETLLKGGGIQVLSKNSQAIAFIITYFNLLGGFFIAVGLFTRWMCRLQIIIIVGAIYFVNSKLGMIFSNTELVLSLIVLILLIVFSIKGSGVLSADAYFHHYTKAGIEPGHTKNIFQ